MSTKQHFLLVALMFLAVVMQAKADTWPDVRVPDGTHVSTVNKHIIFDGLDMRAKTFRSDKSQKEIIEYYKRYWHGRVVVNKMASYQVIGHKQGDYFITIQVRGYAGGSQGRIGIVNTASAPRHPHLGKGLPVPMGSKVFNDIRYPDDPVPARTVALFNDLSPRQNATYFRERLESQGWKPVAGNDACTGQRHCLLRFTRGDSKMTMMVMKAESGKGQSQVVINVQNPEVSP